MVKIRFLLIQKRGKCMYSIYLYGDRKYRRPDTFYGYWTGKTYIHDEDLFPVHQDNFDILKIKIYKSLKRAIIGGENAIEKYTYVCGFDVEDENGNIVYKSYKNNTFDWNDTMHKLYEMGIDTANKETNKFTFNRDVNIESDTNLPIKSFMSEKAFAEMVNELSELSFEIESGQYYCEKCLEFDDVLDVLNKRIMGH